MANENLFAAPNGDTTTAVTLDFSDQSFGEGSGRIEPGQYKLKIEKAEWRDKQDGSGKIFYMTTRVVGPDGYDGVGTKIVHRDAAPAGKDGDEKVQRAIKRFKNLVASCFSGLGQLEALRAKGQGQIAPGNLVGMECFALVDDDEPYNGRVKSRIVFFIPMDEYQAKPGPDASMTARVLPTADVPTTTGVTTAPATEVTPDLLAADGSNGAASGGDAVGALLGG